MRRIGALALAPALMLVAAAYAVAAGPPPHDAFSAAAPIADEQGEFETSNAGATKEAGEPAHAGNRGGASVWLRWTAPRDGRFAFSTGASDFDTLLAVYTGPSLGALTPLSSDDDSGLDDTSEVSFFARAGTVYRVAVDGFEGKIGRVALRWEPAPPNDGFDDAAAIAGRSGTTDSPGLGSTKEAGEPAHSEDIESDSSVWFRWTAPESMRVGFMVIGSGSVAAYTGAGLNSLARVAEGPAPVFDATAGATYHIAVEAADVDTVLIWGSGPPNDDFADATTISGRRGRARGSNFVASREAGEPRHRSNARTSVWYRWRAPRSGVLRLRTAGSSFDTLLGVYRGSRLSGLRRLAIDDDSGRDITSAIRMRVKRGRVYRIVVDGFRGAMGDVVLRWRLSPRRRS